MTKKLIVLTLTGIMAFSIVACSTETSSNKKETEKLKTDDVSITNDSKKEKIPEGEFSEIGTGTLYVVTAAGSTEDGIIPIVYADQDESPIIQIGIDAWEFNGSNLSYIYVDGLLNSKEQIANTQISLTLEGKSLDPGVHKVEVLQYDTDKSDGKVITYKTASYEVKEE